MALVGLIIYLAIVVVIVLIFHKYVGSNKEAFANTQQNKLTLEDLLKTQSANLNVGCQVKTVKSYPDRICCNKPNYKTAQNYYQYSFNYPFIPTYLEGLGSDDPKKELLKGYNVTDMLKYAPPDKSYRLITTPDAINAVDVTKSLPEDKQKQFRDTTKLGVLNTNQLGIGKLNAEFRDTQPESREPPVVTKMANPANFV